MRVPDLEAEIDAWENIHTPEVTMMRMTAKDMLFKKDAERIKTYIAAAYQVSNQQLVIKGELPEWTQRLNNRNNPKSI